MSASSQSAASIRERAKARGEPEWLVDLRAQALARYEELEAPQWRRTDLSAHDIAGTAWKAFGRPALARRSFVKREGVVHLPLAEAAREHADIVQPLLGASLRADKWEALQAALWSDGSLLFVEKDREVEAPIEAPLAFTPEGGVARDLLVLRPRAKANVLTRAVGASPGALTLAGLEIDVQDGASLTLSTLQDLHVKSTLLSWRRATLRRDAKLSWVDGQFGGGASVSVNENLLEGAGSELRFVGAFFGSAGQHMDVTTAALHGGPHTSSQLDMKGALNDDGYSANYSIVFIGPDARNASGHQHQETLVLSEGARADAIPKLDVENNEVSASHGATVGQVDPEQLFYLRSRGFSEIAAKRLIVEGFFEPLLEKVPLDGVREEVRQAIVGRLRG
ncbi:MAG TPA: SufD family Fe-S cluster assembly protein [Candidatus Thermoplasmatota archaeon]|nr:SufD family Fe-S cluster assembly protein [Candidatus Thermoplasmatota archaeon]